MDKIFLKIPLVGFDSTLDSEQGKRIRKILDREGVRQRDLINKQIPSLTCEEETRDAFVTARDLDISDITNDELNPGLMKVTISFYLPKSAYATEFIKYVLGNNKFEDYG